MSPSGYDPVSLNSYTKSFFTNLNGDDNTVSRYAEINTYNSLILGNYNVKYLLALKLGKNGSVGGDILNNKIDPAKWQKVFETTAVAVLENKDYRERTFFESGQKDSQSSVEITTYTPNRVVIKYSSARDDYLVLADTYYPGWKAKVNGKNVNIEVYNLIFRKVKIPKGEGMLEFDYFPDSFRYGIYISLASLSVFALILFVDYRLKKDSKKI
jgi:hypothetical protein